MHDCTCSLSKIEGYRRRISGPLLDRIDIHIEVPPVRYRELSDDRAGESSHRIKNRVDQAREIQLARFCDTGTRNNAGMTSRQLKEFCRIDANGHKLLETVIDKLGFSARAYSRIIKVARTIADLEGAGNIHSTHIAEAVQYRSLDRMIKVSAA